jgi:hypothetical protein
MPYAFRRLPASLHGSTGMYRYTLKFAARSLDESRVRDVLEREFGLSAIAIIRDGPVRSQPGSFHSQPQSREMRSSPSSGAASPMESLGDARH